MWSKVAEMENSTPFDLSSIFIAREHQLVSFSYYLFETLEKEPVC